MSRMTRIPEELNMDNNIKKIIAENLSYYRKKNHFTQKQLAEQLGVKHNAISSWENGVNSIDIDMLYQICQIFQINVDDMYVPQNSIPVDIEILSSKDFTKEQWKRIEAFARFIKQENR